jgi:integrase
MVIDFYDQHGKRRLKTLEEGISKREAKRQLREIEREVDRGTYLPKSGIPDFGKVANDWLKYKAGNVRPSTLEQYKGHVENHLKPYFGKGKVNRINFTSIEEFTADCRKKSINPATLKKLLVTLGQIMSYSVRKGFRESNPVREIEKPKVTRGKKVEFLKPKEIRAFIDEAESERFRTLLTLAVMSGMRQGEILGLKWTDVDWFNCQVHVRRTYNHGQFHEPKSETSRRSIDLGPTVIKRLKVWKMASIPNALDLVFTNEAGKPYDARNLVNREFTPALRRAGLRIINFHTLRHTYASLLIDRGEHPKYIQSQMGHSSINVTMDVYGHLMRTVNQGAAKGLDEAVFGESGDKMETEKEKGASHAS